MPGMNRGGGGGQMMPDMGGGGGQLMPGGGGQPQPPSGAGGNPYGPQAKLGPGAAKVQQLQAAVWSLQESCARGNGSACIQLKTAQQRLQQAMQQQNAAVGAYNYGSKRSMPGTNGRGRPGADMNTYAQMMIRNAYGGGGGGGGIGGGW